MPAYKRTLAKKGLRFYYQGQYLGTRYCSKAIYLTKQEAKTAERNKLKELDELARHPEKANDISLFDLTQARLEYIEAKQSKDYYKENKRYFKRIIEAWGKDTLVTAITRKMVNEILMSEAKRLAEAKKDNFKTNSMLRSLKALFGYGIKIYDLDMKNPCIGVDFYPIIIKLKYIPTDKEIEAIKADCTDSQKLLIDFVFETGCRVMEAIRLKPEDIDGDLTTLWTRKSKNSNFTPRRIPTPDCLKGKTFKGKRVFKEWETYPRFLEEKADGWAWHNLRHKRASIWANNGMTAFEIMSRLGHSNLNTTMIYLQLLGFTRQ